DVFVLAVEFVGDVAAREGLADDLVLVRRLRLGLDFRFELVADLAVPIQLDVEEAPADQLGIGRLLRWVAGDRDDAVVDLDLVRRNAELLRRLFDEQTPRFGRYTAHLHAAEMDTVAAAGAALVQRSRRIAHEDLHGLERSIEFFGHDLRDGHVNTL